MLYSLIIRERRMPDSRIFQPIRVVQAPDGTIELTDMTRVDRILGDLTLNDRVVGVRLSANGQRVLGEISIYADSEQYEKGSLEQIITRVDSPYGTFTLEEKLTPAVAVKDYIHRPHLSVDMMTALVARAPFVTEEGEHAEPHTDKLKGKDISHTRGYYGPD